MEIQENKLLDDLTFELSYADKYENQLNVLKEQFVSILADFKKYYIFFNKNPDVNEYQQMFSNINSNIESINSQIFKMNNNIQQTIDGNNIKIQEINKEIQKEKNMNLELKNKVGIINNKKDSSSIMITNYKELYNNTYYYNISMFFGIIILLIGIAYTIKYK